MTTLILSPRYTEDAQALWRAAIARGWNVERLTRWEAPPHLLLADVDPVLYVESMMGPTLAEQLGLRILEPPVDWLATLPIRYSRRDIQLSTLGEARKLTVPRFVKTPNEKGFPPAVYEHGGKLPEAYDDATQVLTAAPVAFESEFRCFVLDRSVRTFSAYARRGYSRPQAILDEATERAQLSQFLDHLLADETVDLPRACVIDVGHIAGRNWAVVELNAACGAGIYDCDPGAVLDVLRAAAVPMAESPQ